jgi:NAD(P)-dependent dehydrogenase (short-subunit alcohol dehydrogenase family)
VPSFGLRTYLQSVAKVAGQVPPENLLGTLIMDVTQPKSVENSFAQIREYGPLDVLVNNAGIGVFTPFWERDYDEFMQVMSVNAGGTFLCTREALRRMKDQGQGAIINIGSIYGVVSSDPRIYTDCARMNSEVYSASKVAVIHLTKYFAVHVALQQAFALIASVRAESSTIREKILLRTTHSAPLLIAWPKIKKFAGL